MPMTVEILIEGLAVCFTEGNFWRVVFICDGLHPVKFMHNGAPHALSPLQHNFTDRNISFEGVPLSAPSPGAAFNSIFNMAANYAHGTGKLKLLRTGRTRFISMLIPSASLDTHCLTKRKYFVQEDRQGAPVLIIDRVARVICVKFAVPGPSELTMIIKEEKLPDIRVPFPFQDGTTLTLTFNNDCGILCHENDFYLYYDLVKDKEWKKYTAGEIINSDLIHFTNPAKIENLVTDETIPACPERSADLGNCDPVVIEPPPEPFG